MKILLPSPVVPRAASSRMPVAVPPFAATARAAAPTPFAAAAAVSGDARLGDVTGSPPRAAPV
jgi:hypothetical protein